jgi:hypothetical protein
MTNYPPNTLDADDFDHMSIKELLAIGRYINTTKNGENDLVEQDFFDALITRLSDVSEELELEHADDEDEEGYDPLPEGAVCDSYGRPTEAGYRRSEENCTYRRSMSMPRDIRGCVCREGLGCRVDEARESNEDEEEINNFIEEFSAQADVMGGDLGASMHEAIGIIDGLRAEVDYLEEAVEDLLDGDDPMNEYARRWGEEECREQLEEERRFQEFRNRVPKSNPPF